MNRTYEYRLYPRRCERNLLEQMLEQGREVYNAALQECKNVYETQRQCQTALDQWDYFREWRKQAGVLLNASSMQQILRRLDKAYSAFFGRIKKGEPPVIHVSKAQTASTALIILMAMAARLSTTIILTVSMCTFKT